MDGVRQSRLKPRSRRRKGGQKAVHIDCGESYQRVCTVNSQNRVYSILIIQLSERLVQSVLSCTAFCHLDFHLFATPISSCSPWLLQSRIWHPMYGLCYCTLIFFRRPPGRGDGRSWSLLASCLRRLSSTVTGTPPTPDPLAMITASISQLPKCVVSDPQLANVGGSRE